MDKMKTASALADTNAKEREMVEKDGYLGNSVDEAV